MVVKFGTIMWSGKVVQVLPYVSHLILGETFFVCVVCE